MVIWITGYAGAGKTTTAREVTAQLRSRGVPAVTLDGDELRRAIGDPSTGHDANSRLVNAMRICRLARLFESQDLWVVVATMSLFAEVHAWNRKHFDGYLEVLLDVPAAVLRARDPKGIYRRASAGVERHVVGVDLEGELPEAPHLVLRRGTSDRPVAELAAEILTAAEGVSPGA